MPNFGGICGASLTSVFAKLEDRHCYASCKSIARWPPYLLASSFVLVAGGGLSIKTVVPWLLTAKALSARRQRRFQRQRRRMQRELLMAWRPCSGGHRQAGAGGAPGAIAASPLPESTWTSENVFQIGPSNGSSISQNNPCNFHIPPKSDCDFSRDPNNYTKTPELDPCFCIQAPHVGNSFGFVSGFAGNSFGSESWGNFKAAYVWILEGDVLLYESRCKPVLRLVSSVSPFMVKC